MTTRAVPGRTDRVVIVGAGLGGLSAALRLCAAGREVTVLERDAVPGGRAGRLELDGYRFDTGPTVLTMPELIEDAFNEVGESMSDWLDLLPLTPAYRARFADRSVIDVFTDPDEMADEIARTCSGRDVDGYRRFVGFLQTLYLLERDHFIDRNVDSPWQLANPAAAKLVAMGGFRRLAPKVGRYLKDDRLRRIFSFQAMYAGLAPQDALAIYAVISYMDTVAGVYFPRGGMHEVPLTMAAAASKHGVEFRYNTAVERIEISHDRASAVITQDGERIEADVVVVNADLPVAYRDLIPPQYTPRAVSRLKYSPSCFLLHAGSTATYDDLTHHTISFGNAWRQTFRQIIDRGELMSDPSLLVSNPTRTDPSLSADGHQTYYVLFPTPNTTADIDWSVIGPRYRDEVVRTLEARGLSGFSDAIEVEHVVTPDDWAAGGLAAGAPFAAAHTSFQSGPFRSPTLDRRIENLVFCGSNTQPGVGVPMVLLSGRLAAERITAGQRCG